MNDVGAIFGGFALGKISDATYGKRSPVAMFCVFAQCGVFWTLTFTYTSATYTSLMFFFFFFGLLLQSVNNTIAASCSADIGRGSGKSKSVTSTVTGIIDGCGSIGASIAQFSIGQLGAAGADWEYAYLMPISIACTLVIVPLAVVLKKEIRQIKQIRFEAKQNTQD
jgi:sugar phosphate permease